MFRGEDGTGIPYHRGLRRQKLTAVVSEMQVDIERLGARRDCWLCVGSGHLESSGGVRA